MVEGIEELGAELCVYPIRNRETLRQVEVEIHQTWPANDAHAGVPVNLVWRIRRQGDESVCVKPTVYRTLIGRQVTVGNPVRPATTLAADVDRLRLIDCQRKAALPGED